LEDILEGGAINTVEGGLLYFWKNLGNMPWDDSLLSTYKRRTSPLSSTTTHQGIKSFTTRIRASFKGLKP
jgi:hypothetical protein